MTTVTVHKDLNAFTSVGLIAHALAITTFYGSTGKSSPRWLTSVVGFLFVAGLALLAIGIGVFADEREETADQSIASQIQQERKRAALPDTNEVAITVGLVTAVIVLLGASIARAEGTSRSSRLNFLYALNFLGWIGMAFAAGTDSRSISDLNGNRLAVLLPGAALIGASPLLMHYQMFEPEKAYWLSRTSGAVLSLALGSALFDFGTVYRADPSEFVGQLQV
jgi:hypothetical protein